MDVKIDALAGADALGGDGSEPSQARGDLKQMQVKVNLTMEAPGKVQSEQNLITSSLKGCCCHAADDSGETRPPCLMHPLTARRCDLH
jgi:hypothetical protein